LTRLFVRYGLVLLVIVISLAVFLGSGESQLERWHRVDLTEEFSVDKLDEVPDFAAYLQLEDRLFAQMDTEVYAHTATGPGFELVRYSNGSLADPRARQPDWNRSVELAVDSPVGGVLLLHGMSDSPYSLRALGEAFHQQDYQVLGLRLPGHGTAPSGIATVHWQDMTAAVGLAMAHLADKVGNRPIHIVGYSTGAPLALDFALDAEDGKAGPTPASLVLISPAIGVSAAAVLAPWQRRLSLLPGLGGLAWLQIQPEFDPYKYNSFTINAAEQVFRLTRRVASRIADRESGNSDALLPPILVLKSTVDATVSTDAVVDSLLNRLAPNRHEFVVFDINRLARASVLLVSDPGPFTTRLIHDETLPFALTLVSNDRRDDATVVARHKAPFTAGVSRTEALDLAWPRGVISLSHVALPFPADDPLYGQTPPELEGELFLGAIPIQGERGLLRLSADWLLRLRHNPFYDYLETRVLGWAHASAGNSGQGD
jgi:alpha-beta hydrolase superfamily lysophospholipase